MNTHVELEQRLFVESVQLLPRCDNGIVAYLKAAHHPVLHEIRTALPRFFVSAKIILKERRPRLIFEEQGMNLSPNYLQPFTRESPNSFGAENFDTT